MQERDAESANDHYWFRQYSPRLARWCSADPLGGSVFAPQSLNRYGYVLNDPLNYIDPHGLCEMWCWFLVIPGVGTFNTGRCWFQGDDCGEGSSGTIPQAPSSDAVAAAVNPEEQELYDECVSGAQRQFGNFGTAGANVSLVGAFEAGGGGGLALAFLIFGSGPLAPVVVAGGAVVATLGAISMHHGGQATNNASKLLKNDLDICDKKYPGAYHHRGQR